MTQSNNLQRIYQALRRRAVVPVPQAPLNQE